MPRKRKHSDEEDEEETVDAENGVRGKRKAAMEALAKAKGIAAHDDSEEEEDEAHDDEEDDDDDDDEDYEGEVDEEEDEGEDFSKENGEEAGDDDDDENEVDEDDEDVDADAIKVECIEAVLEEPSKDVEGYSVLKKEKAIQKLEMWFSEEMSETIGDITDAFNAHYENKKIPVLQVTKFDVIEETDEIYQQASTCLLQVMDEIHWYGDVPMYFIHNLMKIDVLEAKYDKAYSIREKKEEKDNTNLAHDLYSLVRVDGTDKIWATQYFMPEED